MRPRRRHVHSGAEVHDGKSALPSRAGAEAAGYSVEPTDHVQLVDVVYNNYLKHVYDELYKRQLRHVLLQADEMTLQVLHEPGKEPRFKSFMWLYRISGNADRPIVLYEYQSGRGRSIRRNS